MTLAIIAAWLWFAVQVWMLQYVRKRKQQACKVARVNRALGVYLEMQGGCL